MQLLFARGRTRLHIAICSAIFFEAPTAKLNYDCQKKHTHAHATHTRAAQRLHAPLFRRSQGPSQLSGTKKLSPIPASARYISDDADLKLLFLHTTNHTTARTTNTFVGLLETHLALVARFSTLVSVGLVSSRLDLFSTLLQSQAFNTLEIIPSRRRLLCFASIRSLPQLCISVPPFGVTISDKAC